MFLEYGVNESGTLVRIDAVARGRTDLTCPYCGVRLLAKKGHIKAPHFAHEGQTCAASMTGNASLPAFDRFDLHIPAKILKDLRRFAVGDSYGLNVWKLKDHNLIEHNSNRRLELTTQGKIPLGHLPLTLFGEYQDTAFSEKHARLNAACSQIEKMLQTNDLAVSERLMPLTDLRLYRAQWRRLLQSTLYFIEVCHTSQNWAESLYKIGVTTRDLSARMAEIQADLRPHLGDVSLTVLGTWPHRGGIEPYFKHRYQKQQYRLGPLTEYFHFRDLKPVFLQDLSQMPEKVFTSLEDDLYRGKDSAFEQELEAAIEAQRTLRTL